jgi:DNA polymerase-1
MIKAAKAAKKQTIVLLDAHAIIHRAYHALPDFSSPAGEPTGALYGVLSMLLKIIEEFKPEAMAACFDLAEPTYRHDAFAGYKAKREKTDEALALQINRSRDIFAALGIPIFEHPGFEADDVLGTIAHRLKDKPTFRVVIASGDMDTLQCVDGKRVVVYTLKKGIKDTIVYDEQAVKARFGFPPALIPDYKGLRGDPSDNIPGIAGIGEKTASDLITKFGGLDDIYRALEKKGDAPFLKVGIKPRVIALLRAGKEDAFFSKMLATIRLDAPVDFALSRANWRARANLEALTALLGELGFRSLSARVKTLFSPYAAAMSTSVPAAPEENLCLKRAAVALWLLESERTNATRDEIIDYGRAFLGAAEPAKIEALLMEKLKKEKDLFEVFTRIEKPLMEVIETLNQQGLLLDTGYLSALSTKMHKELSALEADITRQAGVEFNPNSPKQLGNVLFDRLGLAPKNQKKTAGGQRSTREAELEKLKNAHPIVPAILRYRALQKLLSTYVDALPPQVGPDGRLRTTFLQTGTTTGRIASRDPNLQNIPIRTEEGLAIRRAFIAPDGYKLVSLDYSQIELRIAAILSRDQKLIDIFRRGEDVHTGVAIRVFSVDANDVTKEMRRRAKIINFGILYGMGVNALRQNLGADTTREEAQAFLNAYFHTFTRLAEYLEETKANARRCGYTTTLFGRRRHFPGITSSVPMLRSQAERMAINAPVQGTAADAMRIAMNEVFAHIKKERKENAVRLLLQVHDELVFEIQADTLVEEVPKLSAIMENVLRDHETFGVPIRVDAAVGPNWGELKKWQTE